MSSTDTSKQTSDPTGAHPVQTLMDALGLNHGEGYGRRFFAKVHTDALIRQHVGSFRSPQEAESTARSDRANMTQAGEEAI